MDVGIVEPVYECDFARQDPKNVPAGWALQPWNPDAQLARGLFQEAQLPPALPLPPGLQRERLSTFRALPRRMEGCYTEYYARKFARMLTARSTTRSRSRPSGPAVFGGGQRRAAAVVNADDDPVTAPVTMAM